MQVIISVLKTFFGYLVRPQLYPELIRKIYKNIFDRGSAVKGKEESENWCAQRAISEAQAIQNFSQSSGVSIYEKYKQELEIALSVEKNCPVKMGGAGALDLIYSLCEISNANHVLETGVAYGWSSLAALLSLQHREGTLFSSDMPYLDRNNDKFVGCVVPENLSKYWKLFRFADKESLPKIFKAQETFDVIHYDSDKAYNGRMWAYPLLWDRLVTNGFFISDDIGDNAAFMDWCNHQKLSPIIVEFEGKYVGVIQKK